jgi:hypothetical protein
VEGAVAAAGNAFLLAFPALFSIVNPPGGAFIFNEVTADLSHPDRARLAGKVGLYSALVLLGALWGGAYILSFFGISLAALRIAGGLFVALRAWDLLSAPERQEARKQEQADSGGRAVAFRWPWHWVLSGPAAAWAARVGYSVSFWASPPPRLRSPPASGLPTGRRIGFRMSSAPQRGGPSHA